MSHLHQVLKKAKRANQVFFIDPNHTGALGCDTPTARAKKLMERFNMRTDDTQLFIVPYNSGKHWTLSVINLSSKKVYWLDPLKRRLPTDREWIGVVENGIKFHYNFKAKKQIKVSVQWIPLLGIPEQNDGKTCSFWVMRYMRDIIHDQDLDFAKVWERKGGHKYTQAQIDEVRGEWAKHVSIFKI